MNAWGVLVALLCVLLAARYSRWRRLAAAPTPQQAGTAAGPKKQLWIRRDPPAAPAAAVAMSAAGGAGGKDAGDGTGMPTPAQLQDLLSRASSHLTYADGSDGEAQVAAAMAALAAVRGVMAAQGRSEEQVIDALQTAASESRQVVASDTRPGPGWQPLLPQDLGATESLLAETGRSDIIGDAAVDPESYVCPQCGGVVARRRKANHDEHWCEPLEEAGGPDPE